MGELQRLRARAGDPSYASIAQRVVQRRVDDGACPHAARLARSTVYDVFRPGRTRLNVDLVREIAGVLDADPREVDRWLETNVAQRFPTETPPDALAPEPAARRTVALLVLGCVVLNLVGRGLVQTLHLPVYLDMVGTAIAAFALGPWAGAGVGVATNVAGVTLSGPASVPFGLVNLAGALVWGYGARRLGLARTLPRFLGLNLLVAVTCTVVATPILVLVFGGSTGHAEDGLAAAIIEVTDSLVVAVGSANVLASVGDKVISGFLALVALSALPLPLRRGSGVVLADPGTTGGAPPHDVRRG